MPPTLMRSSSRYLPKGTGCLTASHCIAPRRGRPVSPGCDPPTHRIGGARPRAGSPELEAASHRHRQRITTHADADGRWRALLLILAREAAIAKDAVDHTVGDHSEEP